MRECHRNISGVKKKIDIELIKLLVIHQFSIILIVIRLPGIVVQAEFEIPPRIMWGRANMAAVILLLGWLYVFARAEGKCLFSTRLAQRII